MIGYPLEVGKGVSILCLLVGGLLSAAALGLLPHDYVVIHAPRSLLLGGGAMLVLIGFMALARDHRLSDTLASLFLLGVAGGAGWLTFYAPEGTLHRYVPFIPQSVNEALARLLFGLGAAACVGMAIWGLRRILR
ncbi:MAG: hypothetical protein AMJ63_15110 [Myxococcales bacterium SG8_38_1]|nr:MAG: hypothetical protein AMJ63_15110 [Myxococcales bacterium SG8_38_1]